MNIIRRKTACLFGMLADAALLALPVQALPGFKPAVPDVSGEYVYYRDDTFNRVSYAGFLCYDDKNYAARYYAPEDKIQKLPEQSVNLLFSLDPEADHVVMTGEKILTAVTPEETELVNYLHDMVYELVSRRIKAGTVDSTAGKKNVQQEFMQFGGTVSIVFNYLVPLFNVEQIVRLSDKKQIFSLVTAGTLTSSEDSSFSSFSGFPENYVDTIRDFQIDKNAKSVIYVTNEGKKLLLDSAWQQSMQNLWLLGDAAIISAGTMHVSEFTLRKMLESSENAYSDWRRQVLTYSGGEYHIECVFYQPAGGAVTRSFRIIGDEKIKTDLFMLTVYDGVYAKNRAYFDEIVNRYE